MMLLRVVIVVLRNTLKIWPISLKLYLDSHSLIHHVSHPVYATGITNPQNYHVVVFMEWHVTLQLKLFILHKRNKEWNEGNI
jgi:hypothetical protein